MTEGDRAYKAGFLGSHASLVLTDRQVRLYLKGKKDAASPNFLNESK